MTIHIYEYYGFTPISLCGQTLKDADHLQGIYVKFVSYQSGTCNKCTENYVVWQIQEVLKE